MVKDTSKDKISVIIVNYESEKPLLSCLKHIYSKTEAKRRLETIIVNNGTGDSRLLKEIAKLSGVKIIEPSMNVGFAAGVNIGLGIAKHNHILLLNPDTLVSFDSIYLLEKCLKKSRAGIVGGVNYKFNNQRHNTFVRKPDIFTYIFDYTNLRKFVPGDYFHKKHYYLDEPFPKDMKDVGAVSGSFMLIDRRVINRIGTFDERYFMYLEDIDYCLRAREAGFKILICPKSTLQHIGGYSSKNKERVNVDAWLGSRKRYVSKHENILTNLIIQPLFLIDTVIIRLLQKYKK